VGGKDRLAPSRLHEHGAGSPAFRPLDMVAQIAVRFAFGNTLNFRPMYAPQLAQRASDAWPDWARRFGFASSMQATGVLRPIKATEKFLNRHP